MATRGYQECCRKVVPGGRVIVGNKDRVRYGRYTEPGSVSVLPRAIRAFWGLRPRAAGHCAEAGRRAGTILVFSIVPISVTAALVVVTIVGLDI